MLNIIIILVYVAVMIYTGVEVYKGGAIEEMKDWACSIVIILSVCLWPLSIIYYVITERSKNKL